MNSKVLVSGVSGAIGAALLPSLRESGWSVTRLVRGQATNGHQIAWDPVKPLPPASVSGFDAVIHLAGETIFGRWTESKKAKIRDSRVSGTSNLARALAQAEEKPRVFACASAVGYYGHRGDELLNEETSVGTGFAATLCRDWEAANAPAAQAGIRTVQMRIGMVLSPVGGALQTMLPAFRMGLGGNLGNGRQWMSWIHVQDVVGAIHHILRNDHLQGPVNLVSPKPVTNAEFTRMLASALSRPAILPMPAFAVKLVFGQMGEEILLGSQKVEPGKLISSGYQFRLRELQPALKSLLA